MKADSYTLVGERLYAPGEELPKADGGSELESSPEPEPKAPAKKAASSKTSDN